jgi:hypothetical protein
MVTRAVDELQRDTFVIRESHSYRLRNSPEALDSVGSIPPAAAARVGR